MDIWQSKQHLEMLVPCHPISAPDYFHDWTHSFRTDYSNSVGNAVDDQRRGILAWLAIFMDCSWAMVGLGGMKLQVGHGRIRSRTRWTSADKGVVMGKVEHFCGRVRCLKYLKTLNQVFKILGVGI